MPVAMYSQVPSRARMRVSPTRRSVTRGWWRARMPSSPSMPGSTTMATSWEYTSPSGVTTSTCSTRSSATGALSAGLVAARELSRLLGGLLDAADHEEGLFGQVVALAVDEGLEAAHGVGQRDVLAGDAGELHGDVERLREEARDLARALHDHLVHVGELVHAEDGDDVLQLPIALQDLLDARGDLVVLVAHGVAGEDARVRVERVDLSLIHISEPTRLGM